VLNRPLLILPEKLAIISEVLAGRIGIDASALAPDASRFVGTARQGESYKITPGGVAVVSVIGSLINRGAWIGAPSGLVSYEALAHQIESAAKDPKIRSILLDLESPGGECVGCFELAALVRRVNAEKPIIAHVNGMAASAAFAIASGARSIVSTESAISGSIGVVLLHADFSRAIDKAGVTPTFVFAGAHKKDGNAYEPLSKEVTADLQQEVDGFYQMFVDCVAAGRGARLTAAAARATEAKTFIGKDAVAAGLADSLGSFSDLLADLEKSPGATRATTTYSPSTTGATKLSDTEKYLVRCAERDRIKGILDSPEAQWNPVGARRLALSTSKTIDEARAELRGGVAQSDAQAGAAQAGDDHGWQAISDKLNKEFAASQPKRAGSPAQEQKPAQAGAADWSEIADRLNAEKGVSRHGV
jgi:signal peptide peptidase SppA